MSRDFHADGMLPPPDADFVWVFGSNMAGAHGGGAARVASERYGARYGVGLGRTGNAYALPTLDELGRRLTVAQIAVQVAAFLDYARAHANERFWVTRVGCGIAGNADEDIAPLFADAPANCSLPDGWQAMMSG